MQTKGRRSASSHTRRVARSYAAQMGKRHVSLDPTERMSVPSLAGLRWRVVTTAPRQEGRAHDGIENLGGLAYCPSQVCWRHYARDQRAVEKALFTGYLFLGLTAGQELAWDHQDRRRMGINGLPIELGPLASARLAGALRAVGEDQMMGLHDEAGTLVGSKQEAAPLFEIGQKVRIDNENFAAMPAIISALQGKKACVEVEMYGRKVGVTVGLDKLSASV